MICWQHVWKKNVICLVLIVIFLIVILWKSKKTGGGGVEIPENNERMDIIGQNGNDGLHYDKVKKSKSINAPKKTEYSDKLFKELFGDKK